MLKLSDVRVTRENREILHIDQLQINPQSFTLILGHNGSGKSTLAQLLTGQMLPDSGKVSLNDREIKQFSARALAREIGYLPQYLPKAPGLSVAELVKLGRFPWRGVLGRWRAQDKKIIAQAMQQTQTEQFAQTAVDQLSGGERQRAWIAMLLAQQAKLLVLDEPTAALDLAHQYQLLALLKQLHTEHNRGVIVVLHDINLALRFATQVLAMQQGRVFYQGDVAQFSDEKLLSKLFNIPLTLLKHPSLAEKVAVVC